MCHHMLIHKPLLIDQDRFAVQLEYILFCLTQGNIEEAHQAAIWYGSLSSWCILICLYEVVCYKANLMENSFFLFH